jgi:hypothetical protein
MDSFVECSVERSVPHVFKAAVHLVVQSLKASLTDVAPEITSVWKQLTVTVAESESKKS